MRDPLSWSIPLFRAFGIQVRLHILYIIITLAMILRAAYKSPDHWVEFAFIWVALLFGIVLLHEFGHCFAARREGGEASEILMWPLGGLAFCEVPHAPRAHFNTAAGGPLVNVLICLICAAALIPAKSLPPLNPFSFDHLASPQLHNWSDGQTHYKAGELVFSKKGTDIVVSDYSRIYQVKDEGTGTVRYFAGYEGKKEAPEVAPLTAPSVKYYDSWVLWTARVFWMSWFLFLFNLIPAFPLAPCDGFDNAGQLFGGTVSRHLANTMADQPSGLNRRRRVDLSASAQRRACLSLAIHHAKVLPAGIAARAVRPRCQPARLVPPSHIPGTQFHRAGGALRDALGKPHGRRNGTEKADTNRTGYVVSIAR